MDDPVNWSELFTYRRETRKRFGSIWQLPVAKRYNRVLQAYTSDASHVLELGAGQRSLGESLQIRHSSLVYRSMDIDRSHRHDFYSLDEITGQYDIVCMFEVIEHVSPELALTMLKKAYGALKPGGRLFVTTPNIYYPPNYLRDATHITPWCYDELGGVARLAGFEIEKLYRLYNDTVFGKLLHRVLAYPLHRTLGIDFAKQVMLVGKKV
jgi:SAM-dependent methyltransferase